MDPVQVNYTTTEKEILAIIFALDKFRSYLLGSKVIELEFHFFYLCRLRRDQVAIMSKNGAYHIGINGVTRWQWMTGCKSSEVDNYHPIKS
ncbi:hypothetical protein CR513_38318, partial [Mucuna pruriens]